MNLSDFDYNLPDHLIAQYPAAERTGSRLLVVDPAAGGLTDRCFTDLGSELSTGDLLVMNDTKVIPARLLGRKSSGGFIELMVERLMDRETALVQTRSSKPVRPGQHISVTGPQPADLEVTGSDREFRIVRRLDGGSFLPMLEANGHMPLPPYIDRVDTPADWLRYQSVFAREAGAVAAPTASLHFDTSFLETLRRQGVELAYLTLHVGAGTFQPIRSENLASHRLHAEWLRIPPETVRAIHDTRRRSGRTVAVGTTACRALEAWAGAGRPPELQGETDLFIMPGYSFSAVDALLTNFHLPQSSLLMLVCAFAGTGLTLDAYSHAVQRGYRFYSYGDAMFIPSRGGANHV